MVRAAGARSRAKLAGGDRSAPPRPQQETPKEKLETAIAVYPDHNAAENAIKTLTAAGVVMKNLSVVGKGYHSEEKVVGFYNVGDRIKFWGTRVAFWGGFWSLFFGGLFITLRATGPLVVLGFLATLAITAVENAVVVGRFGGGWSGAVQHRDAKGQRSRVRVRYEGG